MRPAFLASMAALSSLPNHCCGKVAPQEAKPVLYLATGGCRALGIEAAPLLPTASGAPTLPEGLAGSISHRGDWAIGLAALAGEGSLGVDLELFDRPRPAIEELVLTERE